MDIQAMLAGVSNCPCKREHTCDIRFVEIGNGVIERIPEIVKELNWMIARQEFIGVDGKLDYLIYNGRLKGGKALMGKMLSICPVVHFTHEGELCALQSVRTQKKALHRTCEILKEMIGDRDPKDYLLWHVYTGTSLLSQLEGIEKDYGITTNHEAVIVSPVSGCHNGPWLAGYGLAFLRREDEALEENGQA